MAEEGNISPGLPPVAGGCLRHRTRYGQTFGCSDPLAATVLLSPLPHLEILYVCVCVCVGGGGGGGRKGSGANGYRQQINRH